MTENFEMLDDEAPKALPCSFLINVVRVMTSAGLSEEDVDVPGVYRVDLNIDAAKQQTLAKRASIALDVFHSRVAIKVLDDFDITVINPQTWTAVEQDPEHGDDSESRSGLAYKLRDKPF